LCCCGRLYNVDPLPVLLLALVAAGMPLQTSATQRPSCSLQPAFPDRFWAALPLGLLGQGQLQQQQAVVELLGQQVLGGTGSAAAAQSAQQIAQTVAAALGSALTPVIEAGEC